MTVFNIENNSNKIIESEEDFSILRSDGFSLINPREIAFNVIEDIYDQEIIYESDFYNLFYEYISDELDEYINRIFELIEDNNLKDKLV